MPRGVILGLLLAGVSVASPARADPPAPPAAIVMRSGDHAGYGRLVFDLPTAARARIEAMPGRVLVHVVGGALGVVPRLPRNVQGIAVAGSGEAVLSVVAGAGVRSMRLGNRLVIDVLDPPTPPSAVPTPPPTPPPAPNRAPPPAPTASAVPVPLAPASAGEPRAAPVVSVAQAPLAATAPPAAAPAPSPAPAPNALAPNAPAPNALAPNQAGMAGGGPVALVAALAGRSLALPFAAGTGAAAFRRGNEAVVVFDEARPIDLAALHDDPLFGGARAQLLPAATVLRLGLPPGAVLRLARDAAGWTLAIASETAAPPLAPIRADAESGLLRLAAASPGQVVSVPDPETGAALLVGTQSVAGEGVAVARRSPDFSLLATFQGIAVEPLSDNDVLRVGRAGFVLEGAPGHALALDRADADTRAAADAARLTRRWDLPALPDAALSRRLQAAMDDAANAPPQARAGRRLAAVQAQLALGLDAEAEALARLAATEDARAAEAPDAAGLGAVAALLAGRTAEAAAIEDPRLTGTDEVALWRAVRRAQMQEGAPEAATGFAATLPLLLAYPQPLRARLLPLAAETMVLGGEQDAARRLLAAHPEMPELDLARAMLDAAAGHAAPALARLDRLAASPDRLLRVRAAVRAVELRLRGGSLTPGQAAGALDRLLYAWRGDGRELALRLRVAELRGRAGDWRAALALLRETADGPVAETWPAQRPMLRARMAGVFAAALAADAAAPLPPVELIALIEDNPDLLPDGEAGRALAARLAERLAALDLPGRAAPLLQKLVEGTPPGPARAELGGRLAALRLAEGDPAAALLALSASAASGLGPVLTESRTLTFARATAARGSLGPAVATLAALDTPAADEARAGLLEAAKDWPAATAALVRYAGRTLPETGMLDAPDARTVLRLAAAAAQAGDEALLARLRQDALPRLPDGKLADMLRMLTERPVQALPDLPRAAQEAALARALPVALRALDAAAR